MYNAMGRAEMLKPQGTITSQPTENSRILMNSPTPTPGSGAVFVQVVNTTTPRPATISPVFWIGGTEKPINMQIGDFWFREDAESVTPDPELPVDPVDPPGSAVTHKVFGTTEPTQFAGMTSQKEPVLRVANGFYTSAGADTYRAIGMRVWIPEGASASAGNAYLYTSNGAHPNLQAPTLTKALPALTISGWHEVLFTTPTPMTPGIPVYVGYEFADGTYMHKNGEALSEFVAPLDGSKIFFMEDVALVNGVEHRRGLFSANNGATSIGQSAPFYGIDIIVDEGPV